MRSLTSGTTRKNTQKGTRIEEMLDTGAVPTFSLKHKGDTDAEAELIIRMTKRKNRKKCILYPEDKLKNTWDLLMTLILLITCIETPYDIAFTDSTISYTAFNSILDLIFLMDIVMIFNSAFYTEDMDIVQDRWKIAISYAKGWFLVDFIAIVPFDVILNATSFNSLVRVARFGRLYKLVKLTRLLRVLKIFKQQNKIL